VVRWTNITLGVYFAYVCKKHIKIRMNRSYVCYYLSRYLESVPAPQTAYVVSLHVYSNDTNLDKMLKVFSLLNLL
jgi:hypothetical protein